MCFLFALLLGCALFGATVGCAPTLQAAKGLEAGVILAIGVAVLLCCLGTGVMLHGWPSCIKRKGKGKNES